MRLTPGIECHTHEYIRTGHLDSKFGFDPHQIEAVFDYVLAHPQLNCLGLHAHIGSQIFERQPHQDLASVLADWFKLGLERGLPLEQLNVGGGLGIRYLESDGTEFRLQKIGFYRSDLGRRDLASYRCIIQHGYRLARVRSSGGARPFGR